LRRELAAFSNSVNPTSLRTFGFVLTLTAIAIGVALVSGGNFGNKKRPTQEEDRRIASPSADDVSEGLRQCVRTGGPGRETQKFASFTPVRRSSIRTLA